jgi:hypothetical protein
MVTQPVSQSTFQYNQNYDIDVYSMFKQFIGGAALANDPSADNENVGIDDLRGDINVQNLSMTTSRLITALNIDPNATTAAPVSGPASVPPTFAKESRCHTFYRLIGLPVVSSDKNGFYNPGFDAMRQDKVKRTVTLEYKIKVASSVDPGFEAISLARETWITNMANIFMIPISVEAGVLTLTSGSTSGLSTCILRKFNSPFLVNMAPDPFDFIVKDQQYAITSTNGLVGKQSIPFNTYCDSDGNTIDSDQTATTNFFNHQHIIVPFMVDPRIDFSIWTSESQTKPGLSKRVAVPFVLNGVYDHCLETSETARAQRPLIEQIITNRMLQLNASGSAGTSSADAIAMIQQFKSIQQAAIGTSTLSQVFSGQLFGTTQANYFAKYLSIIQALMTKLVSAIHKVEEAQGKYYYLPIPSASGPEHGCSVRGIIWSQDVIENNQTLITDADFDIACSELAASMTRITNAVTIPNATPDVGASSPTNTVGNQITLDIDTSNALGDQNSYMNSIMMANRNQLLSEANQSMQIIEMIMGEFSGLGLCDIIAIMAALYVMDMPYVLGLLDKDAYARATTILGTLPAANGSISACLKQLASTVMQFYQIMDVVFINTFNNSSQGM